MAKQTEFDRGFKTAFDLVMRMQESKASFNDVCRPAMPEILDVAIEDISGRSNPEAIEQVANTLLSRFGHNLV